MFGLSMMEVAVIFVVALLVLGPDELPKAARSIGKTLRDVRRAGDDLRDTFEREVMPDEKPPEVRRPEGERLSQNTANAPPAEPVATQPASSEALAPAPVPATPEPAPAPEAAIAQADAPAPPRDHERPFSVGDDPFTTGPRPPEQGT